MIYKTYLESYLLTSACLGHSDATSARQESTTTATTATTATAAAQVQQHPKEEHLRNEQVQLSAGNQTGYDQEFDQIRKRSIKKCSASLPVSSAAPWLPTTRLGLLLFHHIHHLLLHLFHHLFKDQLQFITGREEDTKSSELLSIFPTVSIQSISQLVTR